MTRRKPDVSLLELYLRGSFQRREDYTPDGWRLFRAAWIMGASCAALSLILVLVHIWMP